MENDEKGFIRLSRRFFSDILWNEARTFSSGEAWLDLIQSARFDAAPRKVCIGGREVVFSRGQYPASIRYLADKWKWTSKRVRAFLSFLRKDGRIEIDSTQGINIITLCNYDKYNRLEDNDSLTDDSIFSEKDTGTGLGTRLGTINKLNANNLDGSRAQGWAQGRAHPQKSGHTEGTILRKEKKEYIYSTTSTPSRACTREENLEDFFEESKKSQTWLEDMCMRFHVTPDELIRSLDEFRLECKCKQTEHIDASDMRRHFHDWLRIQINNKLQQRGRGGRHYQSNAEQADEYARSTGLSQDSQVTIVYKGEQT